MSLRKTFLSREVTYLEKNPELNAARRKRRLEDPEYRARLNEYGRKYQRQYYARNPGKRAEETRKNREKRPHMTFHMTSRYLAKRAGVFSDLTAEDALDIYETPNVCAYCGKDCGEVPAKRAVHIDHIIPMVQGGPNSRWNLTKVCNTCNNSKQSASLIDYYGRCDDFTEQRFDDVVFGMAERSGKGPEELALLLTQSHAFEIAFQAQRSRMETLLAA
jgi:5-methylcytosine-specific restriction endonuclease McrA